MSKRIGRGGGLTHAGGAGRASSDERDPGLDTARIGDPSGPHEGVRGRARARARAVPRRGVVACGMQVCMIEVGGSVGDIESLVFLEALRQVRHGRP